MVIEPKLERQPRPGSLAAPAVSPEPSDEGQGVTATAAFQDPAAADTFACTVDYGGGSGQKDAIHGVANVAPTITTTGSSAELCGGGDDLLDGGLGDDELHGNHGDDGLDGGPGLDLCQGEPGTDVTVGCEL